jgi:predicted GNAT family acetyltransferase
MIRKLEEKDRAEVLKYLNEEASINLFMIGDIEAFGFDKDFQELYGQYDEENNLEGVLLRFNENFIPYYKNDTCSIEGFSKIINQFKKEKMISGKENIAIKFKSIFKDVNLKPTYFCEIDHMDSLAECTLDVKIAVPEDAKRIYDFIETIEEFSAIVASVERVESRIKDKSGRIYYVENEKGEILTVSQTTAENTQSAMVVGVATKKEARGRGLMTQCLSKLCRDILEEDKKLCLFYDNPKAGAVYHKIGFTSIDNWMMMTETKS